MIFAGLGLGLFFVAVWVGARLAPFDVWKQVVEERNVAAGVVAGAAVLGIAWIIAAAMH